LILFIEKRWIFFFFLVTWLRKQITISEIIVLFWNKN
jgi:hypothetical protein